MDGIARNADKFNSKFLPMITSEVKSSNHMSLKRKSLPNTLSEYPSTYGIVIRWTYVTYTLCHTPALTAVTEGPELGLGWLLATLATGNSLEFLGGAAKVTP